MQTSYDKVTNYYDDIVNIATSVCNFYKYTHQSCKNVSKKCKNFECHVETERLDITNAIQKDRIINNLYVDLVNSIVFILNFHITSLLLLSRIIEKLIKQNKKFFESTIYNEHKY